MVHDSCIQTHANLINPSVGHPFSFSIALWVVLEENNPRKLLSLSLDLFLKILLFQVALLIFFSTAIFSCDQVTFLQRAAAGSLEEMLQEEPLDYGKTLPGDEQWFG